MKLCKRGHYEICFDVQRCPLCALKHEEYVSDLEHELGELKKRSLKTLVEVDWEMLERGAYEIMLEFNGSGGMNPGWKAYEFLEKLIAEHKGETNGSDS